MGYLPFRHRTIGRVRGMRAPTEPSDRSPQSAIAAARGREGERARARGREIAFAV